MLVPLILADTHRHQVDSNPSIKNTCTKILSDKEPLSEAYSTICVTNSSKIEIEALSYGEMGIGKPGSGLTAAGLPQFRRNFYKLLFAAEGEQWFKILSNLLVSYSSL